MISGGVDSAVAVHRICEMGYKPDLFYIKIGMEGEGLSLNPAKRNVLDLKNETCKNREKRNVLKKSHTRHFKAIKKQSRTGCFYSF